MGIKYKHIFFDLDHTLWDFEKNSNETLAFLTGKFNMHQHPAFELPKFLERFHNANTKLWNLFNKDLITAEELRSKRFQLACDSMCIDFEPIKDQFNNEYLELCPFKGHLMDNALDVLDKLYNEYCNLYILTNGFEHVQLIKLTSSQIFHYFESVYTVKDFGTKKPHANYFNSVMREIGCLPSECVMIGDSLEIDVLGAMACGITGVWYNPQGLKRDERDSPDHEISDLKEILNLVL